MTDAQALKRPRRKLCALAAATALTAASAGLRAGTGGTAQAAALPAPDHVVVVVMENHSYSQIIGSSGAPYINGTLKAGGANLTQSYAITHPSQPNYYALFPGSTLVYALPGDFGSDLWTVPADGSGAARKLMPAALAPARIG